MKPNFEWDSEKERRNIRKHEVNFDDPMFITVIDE